MISLLSLRGLGRIAMAAGAGLLVVLSSACTDQQKTVPAPKAAIAHPSSPAPGDAA